MTGTKLDRVIETVAPQWGLKRAKARAATEILHRHYEAAATGRRAQGWKRSIGDANAEVGAALGRVRATARDLVKNNAHAASAVTTIPDQTVGTGIVPTATPASVRAMAAWKAWAETTDCDADGRCNFSGLQKLIMRTVVESGECLVRRRFRQPQDGFPIPMQLQVLEPDYLDTERTMLTRAAGARIINGVEFDAIGRRRAYWLFPEHPGSNIFGSGSASVAVPAEGVLHIYKQNRPGQVRGMSWFAPVVVTLKDFDAYADAQLMKQKIAAYLSVIVTDPDGTSAPLGPTSEQNPDEPTWDMLKPGAVVQGPQGREVTVVQPPTVAEYGSYSEVTLRAVATGIGVAYEDLTGSYSNMPFSAARMSRLRQWARVEDWRWHMMIPQFCDPAWAWAMEAASIAGLLGNGEIPRAEWTAPPLPMIDPAAEGLAYLRNIRTGIMSLSEALRERGYDPEAVLNELQKDFERLDALGLVLDSDPRKMTQAGQAQSVPGTVPPEEVT